MIHESIDSLLLEKPSQYPLFKKYRILIFIFFNKVEFSDKAKLETLMLITRKNITIEVTSFLKAFGSEFLKFKAILKRNNRKNTRETEIPNNPLNEPVWGRIRKEPITKTTGIIFFNLLKLRDILKNKEITIARYTPKELGSLKVAFNVLIFTLPGVFPILISIKNWKKPKINEIELLMNSTINIFWINFFEFTMTRRI